VCTHDGDDGDGDAQNGGHTPNSPNEQPGPGASLLGWPKSLYYATDKHFFFFFFEKKKCCTPPPK